MSPTGISVGVPIVNFTSIWPLLLPVKGSLIGQQLFIATTGNCMWCGREER